MDLTKLERVYLVDGQLPDNRDKEMMKIVISAVSALVERFLDRNIQIGTYTELFNVPEFATIPYWVKGYPINTDPTIDEVGTPNPFACYDNGTLIDEDDVDVDARTGVINPRVSLDYGLGKFQVVYHGGMAVDTDDFIAKYPDLEYEVIKQVIFEYKRKKMLTQVSVGAGGNSSETYLPFELQPSLKKVLRRYRRASVG